MPVNNRILRQTLTERGTFGYFCSQLTCRPHVATALNTRSRGLLGARQGQELQLWNLAVTSGLIWFVFYWKESTLFQMLLVDIFMWFYFKFKFK